jgi:NitT/TauT family transport system substrate-binding protein
VANSQLSDDPLGRATSANWPRQVRTETARTQTVRVTIANANDLARRREVYERFLRAYRDVIDFMYAEAKAIEAFAKYAQVSTTMAQTVRDRFYPKAMLQLDEVKGLDDMMQDAIAFKYITQPLNPQQVGELLQLPGRRR